MAVEEQKAKNTCSLPQMKRMQIMESEGIYEFLILLNIFLLESALDSWFRLSRNLVLTVKG